MERGRAAFRSALAVDWERELAEQDRRHAREVAELRQRIDELTRTVAQKDRRIAELEEQLARARKTSRNSSKPPSSDLVKPAASQGTGTGVRDAALSSYAVVRNL